MSDEKINVHGIELKVGDPVRADIAAEAFVRCIVDRDKCSREEAAIKTVIVIMAMHSRSSVFETACRDACITPAALAADPECVKKLVAFARDCATNFDCDGDAHRHGTACRACDGKSVLRACGIEVGP